jgi:hypothetical protein
VTFIYQAVSSNLGHGKATRLGAGIVIGACALTATPAMLPVLPQSGDLVPLGFMLPL